MLLKQLPARKNGLRGLCFWYKDQAEIVSVKSSALVVAEPVDATTTAPVKSAPALLAIHGATILPFTMLRAALSKNMNESFYVPTFRVKSKGVTMTVLLAKAAAMVLVYHPMGNASCKDEKSFAYNRIINMVVVVANNGGMITPIL
ncbi:putative dihydrolipoyllysine-residue acetyltransferase [Helianthus anomalus]